MSLFDLALTRGTGEPFSDLALDRIKKQKIQYNKKKFNSKTLLPLIPLVIIAFIGFLAFNNNVK